MSHARSRSTERGAMLIFVAISIFMLTAFSAFVLDYGVLWLARRQAQNAADAGALAGAVSRAYDEFTDPPAAAGAAFQSATAAAQANKVFGEVPGAVVTWECPPFVAGGGCVRVDVYRDGTNGSTTLPAFFGQLLGVASQRISATATAQAGIANSSDCMKPMAVPDKWIEMNPAPGPWDSMSVYTHYVMSGPDKGTSEANPDIYVAPNATSTGTGFTIAADYGTRMVLHNENGNGNNAISPGWYQAVDLPRVGGGPVSGAQRYSDNISSCNGAPVGVGDILPTQGGAMVGPTKAGVDALIALDPGATWNAATKTVTGSCAPGCATISPRIVPLPVFDLDEYQYSDAVNQWPQCVGGGQCVRVVNILGFFVASVGGGGDVTGYLIRYPGVLKAGASAVNPAGGFAQVITLVR